MFLVLERQRRRAEWLRGHPVDQKLIEAIASRDIEGMKRIREDFPSLFHSAAPEGRLNPLYTALEASDKRTFIGKTIVHEFMHYGVSLVATILSAESESAERFLVTNRAETGIESQR